MKENEIKLLNDVIEKLENQKVLYPEMSKAEYYRIFNETITKAIITVQSMLPKEEPIDWMNVSKDELINECKKRYPKGTKFRCANGNNYDHEKESVKGVFTVKAYSFIDIISVYGVHSGNGWLFLKGKWAEIVEEPEKSEPTQETEPRYRVGRSSGRSILHVKTGHEYLIFPEGSKEEHVKEFCNWLNSQPRPKTQEEIDEDEIIRRLCHHFNAKDVSYSEQQMNFWKDLVYWGRSTKTKES